MLEILQENTDALAVFKPSGLPVFPLRSNLKEDTVLNRLYELRPVVQAISWPSGFEGGIAHRLDIPTSGLLVVAKSVSGLHSIRENFTKKRWEKEYFFLTLKSPPWTEHVIATPLGHDPKKRKRMIPRRGKNTKVRGKWYNAQTKFVHLCRRDGISLWRAKMKTGVMHQIRVHAAFAGIALLGDSLYGGGKPLSTFPSSFALHHFKMGEWERAPLPLWWPDWTHEHSREI